MAKKMAQRAIKSPPQAENPKFAMETVNTIHLPYQHDINNVNGI